MFSDGVSGVKNDFIFCLIFSVDRNIFYLLNVREKCYRISSLFDTEWNGTKVERNDVYIYTNIGVRLP